MSRRNTGIVILLLSLVVFLALAWRSLLAVAWLANGARGDGTAREALRVLLEINGLPIVMLGGLMVVLFMIYWRLFVRREDDDAGDLT